MAAKVKGPPQHRCDPISDIIKTLIQPKTKVRNIILSFHCQEGGYLSSSQLIV